MLKFIRGKGSQPSAERQRLQKDLFAYRKTVQHGFPHKPTAFAFDATLRLLAIGTQTGAIKIFGKPGLEYYGQHALTSGNLSDVAIQLLEWIPGSGRVLSLTASNCLSLWEPAGSMLVPIKSLPFDGKLKRVSALCCSTLGDVVWIGTEGGNVYQLDLKSYTIKESVIYHDIVLGQVPATYKLNPGAIESVKQMPNDPQKLLIAYNRGLCVLWDLQKGAVVKSFVSPGHGQSIGLYVSPDSTEFVWYHADGSFATWSIDGAEDLQVQGVVPYGPDPCKSINRLVKGLRGEDELVVFSGGMPRSAYGDHQTLSVHCTDKTKIALDFTSKVIDFFVTFNPHDEMQVDSVIVLLEEEICAYDLTDAKLPAMKVPYLHSIHTSAVTCNHLVSRVSSAVYEKISNLNQGDNSNVSDKSWPVDGGNVPFDEDEWGRDEYELLLTGHEDGSVRFWDCTGVILKPVLTFKTAQLFGNNEDDLDEVHDHNEPLDDTEPPFRKSGQFDPYSDDPRLAVKKISFCPKTGQLVVAGTAGHIVIASLDHKIGEGPLRVSDMNLVSDRDGFVWKGHDQLKVKRQLLDEEAPPVENGLQVNSVLQVLPPAAITCLALQTDWNLVAAGTAHGLVLFDYMNHHPVLHRCTLNPNDLSGAGEALSRRKSFKKTLRESFRRLRKGRSTRNAPSNATTVAVETRPIERQVEARAVDDGMGSIVKCLTFAQTFITSTSTTSATLWSATNASCVSVFILHIPPKPDTETPVSQRKMTHAQLAKEIQMKHRAPIVDIIVFDAVGFPLEHPERGIVPHRVLIASEEQFKVFSLPQLKPMTKFKLTANEGARVRRVAFATFKCNKDANTSGSADESATEPMYAESALLCLTNLGDCLVFSVPELKRQLNAAAIRREDIHGITSLCFTRQGEALYMMSSSEIQRVSMSATKVVTPKGTLDLPNMYDGNDSEDENTTMPVTHDEDFQEAVQEAGDATASATSVLSKVDEEEPTVETTVVSAKQSSPMPTRDSLINGLNMSLSSNKANETTTSSMGDITIDSVRDHLNSTTTTLCSQTTEEVVGRLSVLSTQTNSVVTTANSNKLFQDFTLGNLKDLPGETTETNSSSVVIKSVMTNINYGNDQNGNGTETTSTKTRQTSHTESQF